MASDLIRALKLERLSNRVEGLERRVEDLKDAIDTAGGNWRWIAGILITFIPAVVAIFVSIIVAVSSVSNPVNQPGNETGQVLLLLLIV